MANLISIFRVILVFITVYLLFGNSSAGYSWALVLTVVAFSLDGVDGWVARKLNETSKLGAVIDIIGDRIIENTFWVVFAVLGWLPISFPLIALTRGFVVDGLRSVAMEQGHTAFGETSMQTSKFGYFICCSKFSRILYAVAKALAFFLFILVHLLIIAHPKGISFQFKFGLYCFANLCAFIAIQFCVIRGLPVVFESKHLFPKKPE